MSLRDALGSAAAAVREVEGALEVTVRSGASLSEVMRIAARHEARVRPAGVAADDPAEVRLVLEGLDRVELRPSTHLVHAGAGVTAAALESSLGESGFTTGWTRCPEVPIGALLAAAEPGPCCARSLPGWGPVVALDAVLVDGTEVATRRTPRSATGPDLRSLLIGGGAEVGIILAAVLRVHPAPPDARRLTFAFAEHAAAVAALAEALGSGLFPDRMALLDGGSEESRLTWVSGGEPRRVDLIAATVEEACVGAGGRRLGGEAAGPAGVDEVLARIGSESAISARSRLSRLGSVRRAVLEASGGAGRVHLHRAFPEGAGLLLTPAAEGVARAVESAGARVDGGERERVWHRAVGAALRRRVSS